MEWNTTSFPQSERNSIRGAYSRAVVVKGHSTAQIVACHFSHPSQEFDNPHWEDPITGDQIKGVLAWRDMTPLERQLFDEYAASVGSDADTERVTDWREALAVCDQEGYPVPPGETLAGHLQSMLARLKRAEAKRVYTLWTTAYGKKVVVEESDSLALLLLRMNLGVAQQSKATGHRYGESYGVDTPDGELLSLTHLMGEGVNHSDFWNRLEGMRWEEDTHG